MWHPLRRYFSDRKAIARRLIQKQAARKRIIQKTSPPPANIPVSAIIAAIIQFGTSPDRLAVRSVTRGRSISRPAPLSPFGLW